MLYQLIYTTGFDPQCRVQGGLVRCSWRVERRGGQSGQKAEASETMIADARIAERSDLAAFFSTLADSFLNIELETRDAVAVVCDGSMEGSTIRPITALATVFLSETDIRLARRCTLRDGVERRCAKNAQAVRPSPSLWWIFRCVP